MKTLLLILWLTVMQLSNFNPEYFIGKSETKFEKYCINLNIPVKYGYLNNKGYLRFDNEDIMVICVYRYEVEAIRMYYPKYRYDLKDIVKDMASDLYQIAENHYISIENPGIMYNFGESTDKDYFTVLIYRHGAL